MRIPLTTYNNIYNDIKEKINSGIYKIGDKLPSVKELCAIYDAGDSSIRKSLEMLKRDGYIYSISRIGVFVNERNIVDNAKMHFHELQNLKEEPDKIITDLIIECDAEEINLKLLHGKCVKVKRMYYVNAMPIMCKIDYILNNVRSKIDYNFNQRWISEMDLVLNSHFVKRKIEFYLDNTVEIKKDLYIPDNIGMFKIIKTYYTKQNCFATTFIFVSSTDIKINYAQNK